MLLLVSFLFLGNIIFLIDLERKRRVEHGVRELHVNDSPGLQELGIRISDRMVNIDDARLLNPPRLLYGDQVRIKYKSIWRYVT
jgi:hypothetical protein